MAVLFFFKPDGRNDDYADPIGYRQGIFHLIVFADLNISVLDGFDVNKAIKGRVLDNKVLVISGYGDMVLVLQDLNLELTDMPAMENPDAFHFERVNPQVLPGNGIIHLKKAVPVLFQLLIHAILSATDDAQIG